MDASASDNSASRRRPKAVFISYATPDRQRALKVCAALEKRGINCWISLRDVVPGENYQEAIVGAIREARAVVLLFSMSANASDEIKKELSLSSRFHAPLIALRIDGADPSGAFAYELSTRQWIDASRNLERSIDALVATLSAEPDANGSSGDDHRRVVDLRRRTLMLTGAGLFAASGVSLTWFTTRRGALPAQARRLIDEGHAAMDEATPDQLAIAAARFRDATQIAPTHSEPWGALAMAYIGQAGSAPAAERQNFHDRAADAQRRAFAINPSDGDALAAAVMAEPIYQNWLNLERKCRAALKRRPNHPRLNFMLALCLHQVGRSSEALGFCEASLKADPYQVFAHSMRIITLGNLRRLDDADSEAASAGKQWPRHYSIWFTRFYHYAFHGRPTEAIAMVDDVANRPIGIPDWNFDVARLQATAMQSRSKDDVDAALARSVEIARRGAGFAENAIMFAGINDRLRQAFDVIDAYYFGRGFQVPGLRYSKEQGQTSSPRGRLTFVLFARFMRPLWLDPRFAELTRMIGLDDYWTKSNSRPDYVRWLRSN